MEQTYRVAVLVGSLRRESFNRALARAMMKLAPPSLSFTEIGIGDLPFYDQDLDAASAPAPWTRFRQEIAAHQAVLFVTPEYNRSLPAVLKNAIDVGSRPYGQSVWNGKPAAVVSASISAIGGFGANHALRQSLVFLNMPTLQAPEAYIGAVDKLLAEDGSIGPETSRAFLAGFMETYAAWVAKLLG